MTMSQEKRSYKTYLSTARKARTMRSTAGNQRFRPCLHGVGDPGLVG